MPNVLGLLLAQSDLKDLGMHTELCGDAYYQMSKAGKLTNAKNTIHRNKGKIPTSFRLNMLSF